MTRVLVLRGVVASGVGLVEGQLADVSASDAKYLASLGKVRIVPDAPAPPAAADPPKRERATIGGKRRKAVQDD